MNEETRKQITRNCHYISRFLTEPWEFDDEHGQRQLHYYDFDTDAFDNFSSKNLFAEKDLNSPQVETWLKETLETPLGAVRPRLTAADPSALDG
ncbi:MAG TPA: hypothetical protein VHO06_14070 [Polyangia bacterium]|nr:hypothetical protein [Polyangia bacterium]